MKYLLLVLFIALLPVLMLLPRLSDYSWQFVSRLQTKLSHLPAQLSPADEANLSDEALTQRRRLERVAAVCQKYRRARRVAQPSSST